jgi:bla regulator protein blaR1
MTTKRSNSRTGFGRAISLAIAAGILVTGPIAIPAQAAPSAATPPLLGADGKPLTFDVVSIREDNPDDTAHSTVQNGPTPDGYRLKGAPLFAVIQTAYLPSDGGLSFRPDRIIGVPAWASYSNSINYDIDAKVSEADLPRWKDPVLQPTMLRAMLQTMLADRFKLTIHRENKEMPIYELTLGRKSPKFKPSEATTLAEIRQKHPNVVTLRSGTFVVAGPNPGQQTLFGVTMQDLGTFLSNLAGRPIHDKTGLTGKYDITYQIELRPPPQQDGAPAPVPPDFFSSQISNIVQDQLGLQLKAAKGPVETLVIDHVEQPSKN